MIQAVGEYSVVDETKFLPVATLRLIHRSHIVNLLCTGEVSDGMMRIPEELLSLIPAMRGEFMRGLNAV